MRMFYRRAMTNRRRGGHLDVRSSGAVTKNLQPLSTETRQDRGPAATDGPTRHVFNHTAQSPANATLFNFVTEPVRLGSDAGARRRDASRVLRRLAPRRAHARDLPARSLRAHRARVAGDPGASISRMTR